MRKNNLKRYFRIPALLAFLAAAVLLLAGCSGQKEESPAQKPADGNQAATAEKYTIRAPKTAVSQETVTSGDWTYRLFPDGTAEITAYAGEKKGFTVPDTLDGIAVTGLGRELFAVNKELAWVIVPEGVVQIEEGVFRGCNGMTSVTLPSTLRFIGRQAFRACSKLKTVELPEGLEVIDENAFMYSPMDIVLPGTVTALGDNAFCDCDSIRTMNIPDSLVHIEGNPFLYCSNLTEFTVSDEHPLLRTEDGVLYDKNGSLLGYPAGRKGDTYTIPEGTVKIGEGAFGGAGLKEIVIPESVTEIGLNAFANCKALETLMLPASLRFIPAYMCYSCDRLTTVTIPESVAFIGSDAFFSCDRLETVVLPKTAPMLGVNAFNSCKSLKSIELPEGTRSLPNGIFSGCAALETLRIPGSVTEFGKRVFDGCDNLTLTVAGGSAAEEYCKNEGLKYTTE